VVDFEPARAVADAVLYEGYLLYPPTAGRRARTDARRSTGVHPKRHNAILKIMPNLSPG
jgi:hypothetical protein